jgi:hypothetical protein
LSTRLRNGLGSPDARAGRKLAGPCWSDAVERTGASMGRPASTLRRWDTLDDEGRSFTTQRGHSNRVSAVDGLRCRETRFRGQRRRHRDGHRNPIDLLWRPSGRTETRQFGDIRAPSGNLRKPRTAWWRRQSRSNLSPQWNLAENREKYRVNGVLEPKMMSPRSRSAASMGLFSENAFKINREEIAPYQGNVDQNTG